ncbi:MAG: tetratricopeptide repeat protein [Promethearchaeota archaeon]
MKHCPYCKRLINLDDIYCPYCNKPLITRINRKNCSFIKEQNALTNESLIPDLYWEEKEINFNLRESVEIDEKIKEIDSLIEKKTNEGESIGELLLEKSSLYYKKRDLETTVKILKFALDNYNQENNHLKCAIVHNELGIIFEEMGFFDQAIFHFNYSLEILKDINDVEKIIQVSNNLANVFFLLEEIDKAHEYYNKALELSRKHAFLSFEIKISSNLIDVLFKLKEYERIKSILERNLSYFENENDFFGIINTRMKLGKLYFEQGKKYFDKALEELHATLTLIDKIDDKSSIIKAQLAWECYFLLGMINSELKNFGEAENFLFRSLEAVRTFNIGEYIKEARILQALGKFYKKKKDFNKAIEYYELAGEILYKYGNDLQHADVLFKIGDIYLLDLKNSLKAIDYYNKALEIYEKKNHLKKSAETLNTLGEIYLNISIDLSITYFEKAKNYYSELLDDYNVRLLTEKIKSLINQHDNY